MAVKDGLPATDFSRMNRDYIRNVAEGETVKDGLPATDFSRMNREYIKAVVEEAGGGGGSITVEELNVTENDTYTAPEGKAYSPVIVNVSGGGGGEATIENIELTHILPEGKSLQGFYYDVSLTDDFGSTMNCGGTNYLAYPFVSGNSTYIQMMEAETTAGDYMRASNIAVTGDIEADGEFLTISGEGTVTITWVIT